MSSQSIGMIGLGLLGGALAERFINRGYRVDGFDINEEARSRCDHFAFRSMASARDVFTATDVILLCLPTSAIVEEVLIGLQLNLPGKTIIDVTTGDPIQTTAMGQRLAAIGCDYVDATIAGSSQQALAGEVVVMAGGEAAVVGRCEPIFRCFAKKWFHVGSWGSGARMKLIVNLVLGLNRAALGEGLVLARGLGLDLDATLEILRSGPAYSQAMDSKGRKMIDGDFTAVARLSQHLKDVRLIRDAGDRSGLSLPLTELHEQLLIEAEKLGLGDRDNSAIIRAIESQASRGRLGTESAP